MTKLDSRSTPHCLTQPMVLRQRERCDGSLKIWSQPLPILNSSHPQFATLPPLPGQRFVSISCIDHRRSSVPASARPLVLSIAIYPVSVIIRKSIRSLPAHNHNLSISLPSPWRPDRSCSISTSVLFQLAN